MGAEETYDAAREAAWQAFTAGVEPYQKAYDEAMASAAAEYNAATGQSAPEEDAGAEEAEDETISADDLGAIPEEE